MERAEIASALKDLKNTHGKMRFRRLERYTPEILGLLAGNLYESLLLKPFRQRHRYPAHPRSLLDDILYTRSWKLNEGVTWNDENKQRLLAVNDKFMQVLGKTYNRALSIAHDLENKIRNGDEFVKDYEIEIELTPYGDDEACDSVEQALSEPLRRGELQYGISHTNFDQETKELPYYLDKSTNWNNEYFDGAFDDQYICFSIHQMLDARWSFTDIMNVKKLWADIKVTYQFFEKV